MKTIINPVSMWGRRPLFPAKVGTMPGSLVLIRRQRAFETGDLIRYCDRDDVSGMCVGCTPRWKSGLVRKVDVDANGDGRLFIEQW